MAANVGTAYITISPRISGLNAEVSRAFSGVDTSAASQLGEKASGAFSGKFAKAGAIAGAAASVVSKAFDAISGSIGYAVSRVDTLNNFPTVMQSLGYSAKAADKSINAISNHLDGLPSSTDALASFTQQIASTGGSLGDATKIALAFNDVMLAGGKGTQAAQGAMYQFAQILSKGKAEGEDWNSLMETAPGQMKQLATQIMGAGHSARDLGEYLGVGVKGAIPTDHIQKFKDALVELDTKGTGSVKSFSDQAKAATGGIGTAFDNLKTRIGKAMATVIDAIGQKNISGAINGFSSGFSGIGKTIASFIDGFKSKLDLSGIASTMKPVGDALSGITQKAGPAAKELGKLSGSALSAGFKTLADAINTVKDTVGPMVDKLGGLSGIAQKIAPVAAAIAAIATPLKVLQGIGLAGGYGKFLASLPGIKQGIQGVTAVIGGAKGAIEGVKGAFAALSLMWEANPAGVVIIAIAAVVAALVTLYNTNEDFRNAVNGAVNAVVGFFTGTLVPGVQGAIDGISGFVSGVVNTVQGIPGAIQAVVNSIVSTITQVASSIASAITSSPIFQGIQTVVQGIVSVIQGVIQTITGIVQTVVGFIVAAVTGDGTMLQQGVQGIIDGIGSIIQGFIYIVTGVFQTIANIVSTVFNAIVIAVNGAASGFQAAGAFISQIFTSVVSFISGIPQSIAAFFSGIGGKIAGFFSGIPGAIKGFFNNAVNFVSGVPGRIAGFFSGIAGKIAGFFGGVKDAITKPFTDAWNFVSGIPGRIAHAFGGIHLELPHFKLPHLKITGGEAPYGFMGKGSMPQFGVEWYANGGYFTSPHLIGVGDDSTGGEYVLNQRHISKIADKIAKRQGTGAVAGNAVYVNGARVNDDPQIQRVLGQMLVTLQRKGAM